MFKVNWFEEGGGGKEGWGGILRRMGEKETKLNFGFTSYFCWRNLQSGYFFKFLIEIEEF